MTVELAVAMPAVLLVLALCVSGVELAGQQLRLHDAAADAARSLGRGDESSVTAAHLAAQSPTARLSSGVRGEMVCATVSARASGIGGALAMRLSATSCALSGGL